MCLVGRDPVEEGRSRAARTACILCREAAARSRGPVAGRDGDWPLFDDGGPFVRAIFVGETDAGNLYAGTVPREAKGTSGLRCAAGRSGSGHHLSTSLSEGSFGSSSSRLAACVELACARRWRCWWAFEVMAFESRVGADVVARRLVTAAGAAARFGCVNMYIPHDYDWGVASLECSLERRSGVW